MALSQFLKADKTPCNLFERLLDHVAECINSSAQQRDHITSYLYFVSFRSTLWSPVIVTLLYRQILTGECFCIGLLCESVFRVDTVFHNVLGLKLCEICGLVTCQLNSFTRGEIFYQLCSRVVTTLKGDTLSAFVW